MTAMPVHVWLPGLSTPILAGEFSQDSGAGRFAYAPDYLAHGHPALAPDLPLRTRPHVITRGHAIFPLFLDAGPDTWGRHLLERKLGRSVTELEALSLCPVDGVGNIALGEMTPERYRVLEISEFLDLVAELDAGGQAKDATEEQITDVIGGGTSLGGTKPKLTIERDGEQYLAKFPERGDSGWLPHIECATLKLAHRCGIRTIHDPEVWHLPNHQAALLVRRFDRKKVAGGYARTGFISAHALLRLDTLPATPSDILGYATQGFTPMSVRKSYVALAEDMQRWCGGQEAHREERRELWRRIVFNAVVRNLDDHARNHGLLCRDMVHQHWQLSPAFDLVPSAILPEHPSLCMAYRFVQTTRKTPEPSRLVWKIDPANLVAAATEHFAYSRAEALDYFRYVAGTVAGQWESFFQAEGMPEGEIRRFDTCFSFAKEQQFYAH